MAQQRQDTSLEEFRLPWKQQEVMHPEEFLEQITTEIDKYFVDQGYDQAWVGATDKDPEVLGKAINNRIHIGFHNEVYIRDAAMMMLEAAPDLKAQQALLKQVEDEHKHAFWLLAACQKRGFDPREMGPHTLVWPVFWEYIYGNIRNKENFFATLSSTQLVVERIFGLRATLAFAEQIAEVDPELSELYGTKIHRDEVFHTVNMPESIIRKHCTTLERQNKVRDGFERAKLFLKLMFEDTDQRLHQPTGEGSK